MEYRFLAKKYRNAGATPMAAAAGGREDYADMIDLSLGDPDFITDLRITESAFKDAKQGHTKYTNPNGDPELIFELRNHFTKEYDFLFNSEEVLITVGACHGMFLALQTIVDEEDEIIIHEPYFTPYRDQIALAGGKTIILETLEEEGFDINISKLEALITEKTKAIIINSPNNPTGACFSKELMTDLAKVVIKHDLVVISDEVYDGFCFDGDFIPLAALPGMKERTITLGSFSKDFAMTGWRIGYAVAPEHIINCMKNINEGVCFTAPSISQRAAIHALRMKSAIQPVIVEEFKKRIIYAYERINAIPGFSVIRSKGSIYLFVNIKGTGLTSGNLSKKLLEEAHVRVIPGNGFGASGEGYIRIACTVTLDRLKEAFDRIEAVLN